MADLKKALKDANKMWKGAKKRAAEQPSGFTEYEDGRYMARLIKGEIGHSDSGRLQLVWSWKFDEEPYEGKIKKAYQGLESEDNLVYLARDLERLGYEAPDDLAGVEEICADITKEKPLARIRLRTKGDFQNVYIDKVFGGDEDDTEEEEDSDEEAETETEETDEESDEEEADEEESDEEESDEEESDDSEEEADEEEETEEEEEADDEEDEDAVDVEVGMKVEIETSKGPKKGKIVEVLADAGKVRVDTKDGIVKVGLDKVTLTTPEEPEEKPKSKKTAKPASKPATKPAAKKVGKKK